MKLLGSRILALLAAALVIGVLASGIQTHLVLTYLSEVGAPVTLGLRVLTTLEDLGRFGPLMAGIALPALLLGLPPAGLAARWLPGAWRPVLCAVGMAVALWVVFWLLREVIPMPAIAGTRSGAGQALMALAGVPGGAVYGFMTAPARLALRRQHQGRSLALAAVIAVLPAALFLALAPRPGAQPTAVDPASYRVETVTSGLVRPWSVAFLPDGRLLVSEMAGRLLLIDGAGRPTPVALDGLPPVFHAGIAHGLLEVALDPEYQRNGWLYLTLGYGQDAANGTQLVRARLAGDRLTDLRVLFSSTLKPRTGNNGGRLAFLADGTLVMTLGDGSARREEAQNPANYLGTLVRLDRNGQPPVDNPFIGRAGFAPAIYSLGHRNPQGIARDPATGQLLISEHGARGGDELNEVVPGGNYGWPVVTGGIDYPFARITPFRRLAGYRDPLLEWTPSIAPAGLAVYSGALFPEWQGALLVPALKERSLRLIRRSEGRILGQQLLLAELDERLRDVKVAPDGSIYVLTDGLDARLLRLVPAAEPG